VKPSVVNVLTNTQTRWEAVGDGMRAYANPFSVVPVARHNIEEAAREGYLDGLANRGFSSRYDAAPGPWQRNYEIGRFWAIGIRVCGIDPPEWPEGVKRQPDAITRATEQVALKIGAIRPEIVGIQASAELPTLHEPMALPRRRRRI